jgi:hypothetical protein
MLETFNPLTMYPYLKELTLDEALKLPPDTIVYHKYFPSESGKIKDCILSNAYNGCNDALACDALTYATHILKQAAPPEGWGYAAYNLDSGKYEGLHYRSQPSGTSVFRFENQDNTDKWWYYQFKLTDLARVEGISKMETTETDWEAKYKELERATTSTLNTSHGQRSFGDYVNGYCKQLDLADRVTDLEAKNKELQSKFDELHGYSPKDWKIAELQLKVDGYQDVSKLHLENVFDLHDFYHKIISNLLKQISN